MRRYFFFGIKVSLHTELAWLSSELSSKNPLMLTLYYGALRDLSCSCKQLIQLTCNDTLFGNKERMYRFFLQRLGCLTFGSFGTWFRSSCKKGTYDWRILQGVRRTMELRPRERCEYLEGHMSLKSRFSLWLKRCEISRTLMWNRAGRVQAKMWAEDWNDSAIFKIANYESTCKHVELCARAVRL